MIWCRWWCGFLWGEGRGCTVGGVKPLAGRLLLLGCLLGWVWWSLRSWERTVFELDHGRGVRGGRGEKVGTVITAGSAA